MTNFTDLLQSAVANVISSTMFMLLSVRQNQDQLKKKGNFRKVSSSKISGSPPSIPKSQFSLPTTPTTVRRSSGLQSRQKKEELR